MKLINFKKLSEDVSRIVDKDDDSLREICRKYDLEITFVIRIIHYDTYKVQDCRLCNFVLLVKAFDLDIKDYIN